MVASTDPYDTYLLSAAEEQDLARRWATGERVAYERLYAYNQRLVASIAYTYRGQGLDIADLLQEGGMGLLKAIDRFDPARGLRFSTMAVPWIHQKIRHAIAEQGRMIRIPLRLCEASQRAMRTCWHLHATTGALPSDATLAAMTALSLRRIRTLAALPAPPLSLDLPRAESPETTLADLIVDRRVAASVRDTAREAQRRVAFLLRESPLTAYQRQILCLRYGLDGGPALPLLVDIAAHLGISKQAVHAVEMAALRKMRMYAASHADAAEVL